MRRILAADIGGTNSRFGHFELEEDGKLVCLKTVWLQTGAATSFSGLLDMLASSSLDLTPHQADIGVLAVAGAVHRGRYCRLTNASFDVDLDRAGLKNCLLVNDFVAQAQGSCTRDPADLDTIRSGRAVARAVRIAVGAGTGLGHCGLLPTGPREREAFLHIPSEGGHMGFPMQGASEIDYQKFALARTGLPYLNGDAVVSGSGLRFLHLYLTGRDLAPKQVAAEIDEHSETTVWFARFYARACRQYALALLARGGVWVCGGIAAENPFLVTHPEFCREFDRCPAYGELLHAIPLYLDRNRESGLVGAAAVGKLVLGGVVDDPRTVG
jgi:glucokinase